MWYCAHAQRLHTTYTAHTHFVDKERQRKRSQHTIVWDRQAVCIHYAGFIQSVNQNTGFMLLCSGNSFFDYSFIHFFTHLYVACRVMLHNLWCCMTLENIVHVVLPHHLTIYIYDGNWQSNSWYYSLSLLEFWTADKYLFRKLFH